MARTGLCHVALKARDLKKTARFYVGVLGMKVAFRVPPDMIFLQSSKGDDLLNFIKSNQPTTPSAGLDHIGFRVSRAKLKRAERRLAEMGIEVEGRRGDHAIYFRDPNGYTIEYYCD